MIRKRKKIRLKYKKERILLCDVLPYELPVIFSNRYFYRFLVSNGIELKEDKNKGQEQVELWWKNNISKDALSVLNFMFGMCISKDLTTLTANHETFAIKDLVSIPFLYKIQHKPHKLRRLALIHPVNQIEMVSFYEKYKGLILYYCGQDRYSLRHPEKVACFFYYKDKLHHTLLGKKMDKLELFFNEYENLRTYFSYKEYSNIYKFYEDYRYQNAEKRFAHLHKFDIQSCFDSIYTHTIAWAVCGGKDEYKKNYKGSFSFGDYWDSVMQRMNYNETNGIVIGPEFSRIFAEVILQYVDKCVDKSLQDAGYKWKEHYECYRYVDDVFFYYNDNKVLDLAMRTFEDLLNEYKLSISKEKSVDLERPFITPISMAKIKIDALLSETIKMHTSNEFVPLEEMDDQEEELNEITDQIIKKAIDSKDYIHISSKEFNRVFKSLIVENNVSSKDIMNYTLAVIATKLERLLKKYDKIFYVLCKAIDEGKYIDDCIRKKYQMEKMLLRYFIGLLDIVFFLYSSSKRVNTTLKMMNILNNIIIYLGKNYEKKDKKYIKRFSSAIRDEVFKKIQNEIGIVFKTTLFDHDVQIETLYFLITLKSMPKQYGVDAELLRKYFSDGNGKNFDMSKLNMLSIIILLYYYGNIKEFEGNKIVLLRGINNKYQNMDHSNLKKNTEFMILTLDLLACPYLTHNDRKEICKYMDIDKISQIRIERYFSKRKFMFTKWSGIDLTKELGAKVSQEVYT
jgi:hypothetical protein